MELMDELIDRFGEPPKSVQGLLDIAILRASAARLGFVGNQSEQYQYAILSKAIEYGGRLLFGWKAKRQSFW